MILEIVQAVDYVLIGFFIFSSLPPTATAREALRSEAGKR